MELHSYLFQQSLPDFCKEKTFSIKLCLRSWELRCLPQTFIRDWLRNTINPLPRSSSAETFKKGMELSQNRHIVAASHPIPIFFDVELSTADVTYLDSLGLNESTGAHPDHFYF